MTDLRERLQAALGVGYELERELGGGGMSRVFVALDRDLGRRVVVKVLPPDRAARVDVGRFRREIQLAASLQHPHIVPLLTAHRADDLVYYTMPLIEGESLRARLDRDGALPIEDVPRILRDIVDAIAYAHAQGIVHRDIKPDNVLLSGEHAMVTDFGIAKALSDAGGAPTVTTQTVAVGTPAYMAPEQAAADPRLDLRADIYAVGVLAYELLSGRPPFTGTTTQQVMAAHVAEAPVSVGELRPGIPPDLAQLVMRCLQKDPADRWQTGGALLAQVEALTTSGAETGPRAPRRARRVIVAAGVAVVAVATLLLWRARPSGSTALDPNVVLVLPFRVAGADPSLAYLREGMVDLLAAKLTGDVGPRAVDPRTALAVWHQAATSPEEDLPPEAALSVARHLRAGRLVLGEVVGTDAQVVITASVLNAGTGGVQSRANVQGPIDSLPQLTDDLAGQLLALGAGEPEQRLAALTSTSLPALRAYLLGSAAYRVGRYQEAVDHYQRALQLDSMFALAALRLGDAVLYAGEIDAGPGDEGAATRARRVLLAFGDHLSRRDQALVRARVGGQATRTRLQALADWEAAASQIPDLPEVWFQLGNLLYREGPVLGVERAHERAVEALRRAVALDSTFAQPLAHLVDIAATAGDTISVRQLGARYLTTGSGGDIADYTRWRIAVALDDRAMLDSVRARLPAMSPPSLERILGVTVLDGLPQSDADRARGPLLTAPGPRGNLWAWGLRAYEFDQNRGHPRAARQILESLRGVQPIPRMHLGLRVLEALYGDGDSSGAAEAVRALVPYTIARVASQSDSLERSVDLCVVELWRLRHGDARTAARAISALRTVSPGIVPYPLPDARMCVPCLEALLAHNQRRADAAAQRARLDSTVAARGPRAYWLNLDLARLYEGAGDLPSALAALRRRPPWWARTAYLSTFLREEGRLAGLAGDRAGTIRAYQHYLALRPDPELALRPQVEQMRAELAKLTREAH